MDFETILFIALALGFSIFSMYVKSKKQKQQQQRQPFPEQEESCYDFPSHPDSLESIDPIVIFEQYDTTKSTENFDIYTKKEKKKQKTQKFSDINFQAKNPKNTLQNTDLEDNISLLEDFEGTEMQKAFLYSEIFKNPKS